MRISFSILLFFAAVLPFLHAAEKTPPQDETDAIAASVNGDPISVRDLLAETARQESVIRATLPKPEQYHAILKLRQEALERAIDRKLLLDAYRQQEFKIPEQYIESSMDEIALSQAIRSRREFYAKLREQNTTPEKMRKLVREQLILQAMTARRIQIKGQVTPKEIREYFEAHRRELGKPETWELAMIAIPADSPAHKAPGGVPAIAEALKKNPAAFAAIAAQYSTGPNAVNGGSLGWIPLLSMRPEFLDACKDAKPGEPVGPFKADNMDYFLKILQIKPAEEADFAQLEPALRKKLEAQRAKEIMAEYFQELRRNAVIRIYQ